MAKPKGTAQEYVKKARHKKTRQGAGKGTKWGKMKSYKGQGGRKRRGSC